MKELTPLQYFLTHYNGLRDVDKDMIENFEKGLHTVLEKGRKGTKLVWKKL